MTRTSKFVITAALTLGLVGGVAAYGKYRYGDPTRFSEHMIEHVSDELELSAMQEQSLQGLADELLKLKAEMASDLRADKQALRDLVAAERFDQGKALEMINTKATAIQNNAPSVVAALASFLDGLSAEQKADVLERMDHHKRRRHHGRHDHHDHDD